MALAYSVLNGHFGPVYLLQVSKNDDEEHCFLKKFGFIKSKVFMSDELVLALLRIKNSSFLLH